MSDLDHLLASQGDDARARVRAASARRRSPLRSVSPRPTIRSGKVLVLTVDPARRLADGARRRSVRQRGAARAVRGVRGAGQSSPRRAVGGDARHEGRVGRPDPTPRARRRGARRRARQPAVPEHHRAASCTATTTWRWSNCTTCTPSGRLRPRHRRHAAVAERAVVLDAPGADDRVLRQPPAALAHRAVPVAICSPWPRSPSTKSPIACSARGSCRTSPTSSCCSRRWRPASSPAPARSRRCSSIRARRSSSCRRSRRRRRTRRRSWRGRCVDRGLRPRRDRRQPGAAGALASRGAAAALKRWSTRRTARWLADVAARSMAWQCRRQGRRRRSSPRSAHSSTTSPLVAAPRGRTPERTRCVGAAVLVVPWLAGDIHDVAGLGLLADHLRSSTPNP